MPDDLNVPQSSKEEAINLLNSVEDFILIQSQSNHSNAENAHWPHWNDFINYVIENNNEKKIVLVGENAINEEDNSKILDLRGKTSSADVVFYLAELSSLVITVPNGVYHWCNIKDLNAINISTGISFNFWVSITSAGNFGRIFDFGQIQSGPPIIGINYIFKLIKK